MKTCKKCGGEYEVTGSDLEFYKKLSVPAPTHCPTCREQRRLVFRNERCLYSRKCDLCGKSMIAMFPSDSPFEVYCVDCWWSDKWDPFSYSRDFDFERPFFEQFVDLMKVVPKVGLLQLNDENSEYNNLLGYSKNTYMSPGSYMLEDCYFVRKGQYCKDCVDCAAIDHCELVKECVNCNKCYSAYNLLNCNNCSSCGYLADCVGCRDCFMCAGLFRSQYCFKNEQYSRDEYEKLVKEKIKMNPMDLEKELNEFSVTIPKKAVNLINCEDCSGDYLQNCKGATECYDSFDLEDCKYVIESAEVKDSMDISMHDKEIELCYELCSGGDKNVRLKFSYCSCAGPESEYLWSCFFLADSFGCDGYHAKAKNCILNKQYSKEEYEKMKVRIIEHMKNGGEYGEFFPTWMSPHDYNETVASEYYPLTKEEALDAGYGWLDVNPKEYRKVDFVVPESIVDVSDDIVGQVLGCEKCGKNYKFLPQELALSRRLSLPLSQKCGECRYMNLLAKKNPRKLWKRKCDKCGVEIETTFSSDSPEKVYCEKCYLGERG